MIRYIHKQRKNKRGYTISVDSTGLLSLITSKRCSKINADKIIVKNMDWIRIAKKKQEINFEKAVGQISDLDLRTSKIINAKVKANDYLLRRCKLLAKRIGLFTDFQSLEVKKYKTKWGTCDNKGNITLNWRLMLLPRQYIDYVIIHELCHLKVLNHSKHFWELVAKWCANYDIIRYDINKKYQVLNEII